MEIVAPDDAYTVTTPHASMASLATPRRGSSELSTWRVRMEPGQAGPVHAIDREQVWMVTSGALEVTAERETRTATAGQALLLPPGGMRQLRAAGDGGVEALVAMRAGGSAELESGEKRPLPWAE